MDTKLKEQLTPGRRVRITQSVRKQNENWQTTVEGEVVSCRREPTGSWYAHGKRVKLWLDRVTIRKDDGELSELVLDEQSEVEPLG